MRLAGALMFANDVVKLRCKPASMPCSCAIAAARSESSMNTIALTDETAPSKQQSRIRSVVRRSRPQSSAFIIRRPVFGVTVVCLRALFVDVILCLRLSGVSRPRRRSTGSAFERLPHQQPACESFSP